MKIIHKVYMYIINRSYHFYFVIIPNDILAPKIFFNRHYFEYIFDNKSPLPDYVEQGNCDIFPNQNGILFDQYVLQQFDPKNLIKDYNSCFAFNLPSTICDQESMRYRKKYTFGYILESFRQEISMDLILQYESSPWKPILEIDPDFFYLRDNEQILIGSKDFKQIELITENINSR